MHYNPCGKAVDMARRPYSTDARFFKDSDQVVRIRWYPVTEPVETLPFPSKINSLDWSSHPWLAEGVGEVWGSTRPYNGAKALPYAVGLTPCKPAAVFVEGEVLDPDAPPQVYNLDQFPACCLNEWIPQGGIEWGGSAGVPNGPFVLQPTCLAALEIDFPDFAVYRCQAGFGGFAWFDVDASVGSVTAEVISESGPAPAFGVGVFTSTPDVTQAVACPIAVQQASLFPGQQHTVPLSARTRIILGCPGDASTPKDWLIRLS